MVQIRNKYWAILFLLFLFVACDKNSVFDNYKELNGTWSKKDTIRFDFEQNDSINPYNLFINIRNNKDYPFNNLYLIVSLKNPKNEVKIDTLEYQMANPDGYLLGNGFLDVKESKLWYLENFNFENKGKYEVNIVNALGKSGMISGLDDVDGILEVGFRIEKTK